MKSSFFFPFWFQKLWIQNCQMDYLFFWKRESTALYNHPAPLDVSAYCEESGILMSNVYFFLTTYIYSHCFMLVTCHRPKQIEYVWNKKFYNKSVHCLQTNRVSLYMFKHFLLNKNKVQDKIICSEMSMQSCRNKIFNQ